MWYAIVGILGFILGFFAASITVLAAFYSGTFFVNETNPDKDVYRIEFDNLSNVAKERWLLFKVDRDS